MKKKLPQPWFRPSRGVWYVTLSGKQHNLGPDEDEAFRRYEQLLRSPKTVVRKQIVPPRTVVGIIDRYLDWCSENRSPETYEWYRWRLQMFVDSIDKRLTVAQLRPFHLDDWLQKHRDKKWSNGTKHGSRARQSHQFREICVKHRSVAACPHPEKPHFNTRMTWYG